MKDSDVLRQSVIARRSGLRQRQKESYELAKRLGFSAAEAAILQNWAEARILALAEERKQLPQEG